MKPTKSILDRSFEYVNAAKTDIRKTFERERARLAATKRVIPIKAAAK